jgi:transcription initiation factor TFIID subunit 2
MRYCYNSEETTQELFTHKYVPRPNDFTDLGDYFVRKVRAALIARVPGKMLTSMQSIVTAISLVRLENGKAPPIVRQFLIDQLRYNDNTNNPVRLPVTTFSYQLLRP